jgi:signal peptide peptidase SppA
MRSLLLDMFNTGDVLALEESAWRRLAALLDAEAHGPPLVEREIRARLDTTPARPVSRAAGAATAVVPITGMLFKRKSFLGSLMGWQSLEEIVSAVEAAGADPRVQNVALLVDSPGGTTDGLPEAADVIAAVARRKPTTAIIDGLGASAAYWLASGAGTIVATPSSQAGSIGVLLVHQETSKLHEQLGITNTVMTAGRGKGEGNSFRPLTAEDRAAFQRKLDVFYSMFVRAVAAGRHTTPEAVRNGPAGRVLVAVDALAAGLVDRIATTRETLGRLVGSTAGRQTMQAAARGRLVAGADVELLRLRARAAGVEVRRRRLRPAESQDLDVELLKLRHRAAELG